jgi:hypothetical protein
MTLTLLYFKCMFKFCYTRCRDILISTQWKKKRLLFSLGYQRFYLAYRRQFALCNS